MSVLGWILCGLLAAAVLIITCGYILFRRKFMTDKPEAFDSRIASYHRLDQKSPQKDGKVLFVGSSVMEYWRTVEGDLAPLPVLNRGIAGSKIVQWPHYVDRLVLPYRPKAVILYAGSNDMHGASCKPPERILEAFTAFAENVHKDLPVSTVFFLSILPSPNKERWANWEKIRQANLLIMDYTKGHANLGFIDCTEEFLKNGQPRPELFLSDGVHLNREGYKLWTQAMKQVFPETKP